MHSQPIYGEPFPLYEETVKLPDGETIKYAVNRSKDAAAVLLVPKEGDVLLTYQYRFPIDSWIYDLPGGKVNAGESPKATAIRECIEETGYKPKKIKKLVSYYMRPGRSDGMLHIFFSNEMEKVSGRQTSSVERVQERIVRKEKLDDLLKRGAIVDPTLLIAWHTAKFYGYV